MCVRLLEKQVGAGAGKAPSLMNIQMELRKCCNHPFMVRGVEDHEVDNIVLNLMEEAQNEVRSCLKCFYSGVFDFPSLHGFSHFSSRRPVYSTYERKSVPLIVSLIHRLFLVVLHVFCHSLFFLMVSRACVCVCVWQDADDSGAKMNPQRLNTLRLEKGLIHTSGKMVLLDKLLPKLKSEGHKVRRHVKLGARRAQRNTRR